VLLILLAAILISFIIKTFLIRSFYIPSPSMEQTLLVNDRIIVNELVPDLMAIEHGDVVVFRDPGGWLTPLPEPEQNPVVGFVDWLLSVVGLTAPDSNDHLVKRVIGLPGDHVVCCNDFGQMSINGVPLEEPYIYLQDGVTRASGDDFDIVVPEDSLWVMGDNRYNSQDSRYNRDKPGNGFVPLDHVVGKAFVISWPIDRWTWIDNYPTTFAGVEEAQDDPPASPAPSPTEAPAG
jgi:signal peptidase I